MVRRSADSLSARGRFAKAQLIDIVTRQLPSALRAFVGPRGLRVLLNTGTAVLVLSLPYSAATSARAATPATETTLPTLAAIVPDEVGRAQTAARGVIAGSRSPITVATSDVRPVIEYDVKAEDTLSDIAEGAGVPIEALAFANNITAADEILHIGQKLLIPPGNGALYYVKDGDTPESVAVRFKVDPKVIMSYNRVYFEPEHFAPGQLIFVPGADLPVVKQPERPRFIPIPTQGVPARTGRLSWPVNGVLTQAFWWGHTGVDIAAPYGTTIGASDDGIVVATGWVAVGGLRVCVQHSGGLQTCYYHTGAVFVSPGQQVARGQAIASIGMTGVTTGPHVHWEAKLNGTYVDPRLQ